MNTTLNYAIGKAPFVQPKPEDEREAKIIADNKRVNEDRNRLRRRMAQRAFDKEMAAIEEDYS